MIVERDLISLHWEKILPIPSTGDIALPLLKLLDDKNRHTKQESVEKLRRYFNMTLEEWEELTPSKTRKKFDANILWTISKLRHAKLLENTRLGEFKITQRGLDVLKQNPEKINERFLRQFPEYRKFVRAGDYSSTEPKTNTKKSPLEEFEEICQKLTNLWAEEILDLIKSCDSATFERLVIHLVVKMGYGGTVNDAGKTVRYGDGCVDGVIKETNLGLGKYTYEQKIKDPK